nr:hypothetical protein Q903MT_gene516 [Picea sitchensis]
MGAYLNYIDKINYKAISHLGNHHINLENQQAIRHLQSIHRKHRSSSLLVGFTSRWSGFPTFFVLYIGLITSAG